MSQKGAGGVPRASLPDPLNKESPKVIPLFIFFSHLYFPAFGKAVVTGVVPSPSRFLLPFFIAHRVQQSLCSSNFHRVCC